MWLCILTGRWFEETFENAQWSKMLLCILTSRRFEEAFENTVEKSQTNVTSAIMPIFFCFVFLFWEVNLRTHLKTQVKQMQPVLLWIISCRQFKETLKNVWTLLRWRKRVQLMWLWIITGTQFLKTFEETKQVCADRLTDIHILGQSDTKLVWGSDSNDWEIMNESIYVELQVV